MLEHACIPEAEVWAAGCIELAVKQEKAVNTHLSLLFFFFFYWIFYLYTFQILSSLTVPPPETPYTIPPPPASIRVLPQPTHSCLPALAFPYTGALSLHRTKGLSSHWYWKRPSSATYADGAMGHSMYSLVGSLVPGSSGGFWLFDIVVPPMRLQTPSAPSVLSLTPPLGTPWSVQWLAASIHLCICQALAAISVSCQQTLLGISNSVWVWELHMWWSLRWHSLWMALPSVSTPHFVYVAPPTGILFPLLRRTKVSILWSSFLSSLVYELYLGHFELWA